MYNPNISPHTTQKEYHNKKKQKKRMKINPDYTLRDIAGETIIVDQGNTHTDMTRIISLNTSARLLWEHLIGKDFCIDDAACILSEQYGIDKEQATTDATRWAERLRACGGILDK